MLTSHFFTSLCRLSGIRQHQAVVYRPKGNGRAETALRLQRSDSPVSQLGHSPSNSPMEPKRPAGCLQPLLPPFFGLRAQPHLLWRRSPPWRSPKTVRMPQNILASGRKFPTEPKKRCKQSIPRLLHGTRKYFRRKGTQRGRKFGSRCAKTPQNKPKRSWTLGG